MRKHLFSSLWARKRRLLGGAIAVVIGVADMSTRSTVDERLVSELAGNPDVASALPVVEGVAQLSGADGELIGGDGPPTFGENWLDFGRNPYELVDGRAPQRSGEI